MQPTTVERLASLVRARAHGELGRPIRAARTLQEAGPDDITFLETDSHLRLLKGCRAAAVVLTAATLARWREQGGDGRFCFLEVADALAAFVAIAEHLQGPRPAAPPGIDPRASVHPTARLGPGCRVLPFAVIAEGAVLGAGCTVHSGAVVGADCRLGDEVILYPNAVLYDRTVLGHRVIVHAGAVLGADGFGYRLHQGRHAKVPQLGHVEVGDEVEIGAGTTIDRGTFGATRVGAGTKIDNQVMVGHNCTIGAHNLIISQVGIAGSCTTGDYVVLAGQVGIADHVTIHTGAAVGAGSGLHADVPAGARVFGYPALPERQARRVYLSLGRLPELVKDVAALKRQLGLKEAG